MATTTMEIGTPVKQREDFSSSVYEQRVAPYKRAWLWMWIITSWVIIKKFFWEQLLGRKLESNTRWFDKWCPPLDHIKNGAGSWKALDVIYNHECYQDLPGSAGKRTRFWLGMRNAQAVRNRKRMVADLIRDLIYTKISLAPEERVRIFSVASGSAQAVLEGVKKAGIPAEICLLDLDQTALDYSTKLVEDMGLSHLVTLKAFCQGISECRKEIQVFKPHIIEMVGFLDYRSHKKAVILIRKLHSLLPVGAHFITANICPNPERWFLYWVINWWMIYRPPEELVNILEEAGFEKPTVQCEPLGIHAIALCQKL